MSPTVKKQIAKKLADLIIDEVENNSEGGKTTFRAQLNSHGYNISAQGIAHCRTWQEVGAEYMGVKEYLNESEFQHLDELEVIIEDNPKMTEDENIECSEEIAALVGEILY